MLEVPSTIEQLLRRALPPDPHRGMHPPDPAMVFRSVKAQAPGGLPHPTALRRPTFWVRDGRRQTGGQRHKTLRKRAGRPSCDCAYKCAPQPSLKTRSRLQGGDSVAVAVACPPVGPGDRHGQGPRGPTRSDQRERAWGARSEAFPCPGLVEGPRMSGAATATASGDPTGGILELEQEQNTPPARGPGGRAPRRGRGAEPIGEATSRRRGAAGPTDEDERMRVELGGPLREKTEGVDAALECT